MVLRASRSRAHIGQGSPKKLEQRAVSEDEACHDGRQAQGGRGCLLKLQLDAEADVASQDAPFATALPSSLELR